ncbi:ester cyclase [Cognatishimia sp. F0-27]|uniref:ester cyclase n=1 Tax=Cognatishimia sp. F0-27 TaxID=2816855 RepID=UPI001D0C1D8D|nr:ester cyclase [Cognatishimia sp. F0-27]MCC1492978.1 nuclear transport factor 2 family protein [Cognatishimia sp. F0-27]
MNDQAATLDPALQDAKAVATRYYTAIDAADPAGIEAVMDYLTTPDFTWHGYCPFEEISAAPDVAREFWAPLKTALVHIQRRQDIFFAGRNHMDDNASIWVVSMGHLMGLFDAPWLGIRPTRKLTMLRYCSFVRVVGDKVAEEAMFFDIPHLMMQAGQNPFPPQTGASLVQPGPMTHDGLLMDAQPAAEGEKTLALINAMISDLGTWNLGLPLTEELARTWHDDMLWWGPAGIGATYTIERYAEQHSGPFRASFTDRAKTKHIARLAEGAYGGFFGWPNFTARPTGGFMGMPATDKPAELRVIDIYRRDGDKLAENWIFIDILLFWKQQGVDILDRAVKIGL